MALATIYSALIVDSDDVYTSLLAREVKPFVSGDIHIARVIDDAMILLHKKVDLILTEVIIGCQSCFPLLRAARDKNAAVPILTMSGRATRPQIFRLRDYGVCAYLDKPIDLSLLRQWLEALSDGRELPRPTPFYLGNGIRALEQHVDTTLVEYRRKFAFTRAEVEVLRYALCGMNRADISRERRTSQNTVKTQIRNLLNKSGLDSMHSLLLRVRADVQRADTIGSNSTSGL